jgi:hypothetical protein
VRLAHLIELGGILLPGFGVQPTTFMVNTIKLTVGLWIIKRELQKLEK